MHKPQKKQKQTSNLVICGAQILTPKGWLYGHALIIEDGVIKAIVPVHEVGRYLPSKVYEFPADFYVVPGFIDVHLHGLYGADVMDASLESLQMISTTLAKEGVTSFLATTMSTESSRLLNVLETIAAFAVRANGSECLGVHLEGPFISSEQQGAQRKIDLPLDYKLFAAWQKAAKGKIKLVTLAPELPGADELITYLKEAGIKIAIGHSNATYEETLTAIKLGGLHATHLFNAMRGIHHRAPGVCTALLLDDDVSAELIVDGHHLHPAMVALAYRLKPKDKLLLVTDSMRGKCLTTGEYELGGQMVTILESGKAILNDGTLAGSVLSLPEAIKNMVQASGCTLAEAVAMATHNPAKMLGLSKKGSLVVDYDADVAILNETFDVMFTLSGGKIIYPRTD